MTAQELAEATAQTMYEADACSRALGLELEEGALLNASGVLTATGHVLDAATPVAVPSTARRKRG